MGFASDSPIFGAIFMANKGTKKECLKRTLFGLPPPQINFVKKVKCGMILFLFEFEERKLFGVFQAISDGAFNIVPSAYDGKFPAQIRVRQIWDCKPLYEREFRNAILDNYYMPNKFNLGLSKHQVLELLCLFDSRKIRVQKLKSPLVREKLLREECLDKFAPREKSLERSASLDMDSYPNTSASDIPSFSDKEIIETKSFIIGDSGLSSAESQLSPFCVEAEKTNLPSMKPVNDVNLEDTNSLGDFIPLEDENQFEPVSALPLSLSSGYGNTIMPNLGVYEDLPLPEPSLTMPSKSGVNIPYNPSEHPPYVPSCHFPAKLEVGSPFLKFQNAEHTGLQSDAGNERVSVFSRLKISLKDGVFSRLKDCKKISLKEEDVCVGIDSTDLSVDELMDMLSQCQKRWTTATELKSELSEVDDNVGSDISQSEYEEDTEEQLPVEETSVDFKRRNRTKTQSDSCVDESDGVLNTVLCKRRKLRRPSFVSENTHDIYWDVSI